MDYTLKHISNLCGIFLFWIFFNSSLKHIINVYDIFLPHRYWVFNWLNCWRTIFCWCSFCFQHLSKGNFVGMIILCNIWMKQRFCKFLHIFAHRSNWLSSVISKMHTPISLKFELNSFIYIIEIHQCIFNKFTHISTDRKLKILTSRISFSSWKAKPMYQCLKKKWSLQLIHVNLVQPLLS